LAPNPKLGIKSKAWQLVPSLELLWTALDVTKLRQVGLTNNQNVAMEAHLTVN